MKVEMPTDSGNDARVVRFPPRTLETAPGPPRGGPTGNDASDPAPAPAVTSHPDTGVDDTDDFKHRMWANAAALVFTVVLTAVGIWLAMSIADMRATQDCVLTGRSNCAPIATPHV